MRSKICSKCKIEKEISEFFIRPNRKCGYGSHCKKCISSRKSIKYRKEKNENPIKLWVNRDFHNVKHRAKKLNKEFDLTIENFQSLLDDQNYKCLYCSNDLNFQGTSHDKTKSPTIDRLIPTIGYLKENVIICCHRCNAIKNDATLDELKKMVGVLENLLIKRNLIKSHHLF